MSTTAESYLVGLIGDGITASLTPPLHEAEADHHGLRYLYRPVDLAVLGRPGTDVGALLQAGRDLGFNAFNITHPCKQLVLEHLTWVEPSAAAIGAVNTVLITERGFEGYNTDHSGFLSGFRSGLAGVELGRVVQFGAGGAGSAVAEALLAAGVGALDLVDADAARAASCATHLAERYPHARVSGHELSSGAQLVPAADGVVNATPVGMWHHPGTPFDVALLSPRHWVADVVYLPLETPLVRAAKALGCAVLDGGHMAVGQAVDAFRLITGVTPDRERMREDFIRRTATAPDSSTGPDTASGPDTSTAPDTATAPDAADPGRGDA